MKRLIASVSIVMFSIIISSCGKNVVSIETIDSIEMTERVDDVSNKTLEIESEGENISITSEDIVDDDEFSQDYDDNLHYYIKCENAYEYDSGSKYLIYKIEYDEHGNELKRTEYDGYGKVLESYSNSFEYDNHGNLIKTTFPAPHGVYDNDSEREYRYDETGRIIESIFYFPDKTNYYRYEINGYDEKGNITITTSHDKRGSIYGHDEYDYDNEGRILAKREFNGYGKKSRWMVYEYDDYGNESFYSEDTIDVYENPYTIYQKFSDYEYDENGLAVHAKQRKKHYDRNGDITYEESLEFIYKYDKHGNIIEKDYINSKGIITWVYEYEYGVFR